MTKADNGEKLLTDMQAIYDETNHAVVRDLDNKTTLRIDAMWQCFGLLLYTLKQEFDAQKANRRP